MMLIFWIIISAVVAAWIVAWIDHNRVDHTEFTERVLKVLDAEPLDARKLRMLLGMRIGLQFYGRMEVLRREGLVDAWWDEPDTKSTYRFAITHKGRRRLAVMVRSGGAQDI